MTDTLQIIAENTATFAALLGKFVGFDEPVGKLMPRRWAEKDKPAPPEETRTPEEVIKHVIGRLKEVSGNG